MIDSTAIIHPSAQIAPDVSIGAWSTIAENVVLGEGTQINTHVVIGKNTKIGKNNQIYSHAVLGTDPQHLLHEFNQETFLEMGDDNTVREFVTINRGANVSHATGITTIGNQNYFMAYAHVAHDCDVGNHVVFYNQASIAGHVQVHDHASLGPFSGVHQFCCVGTYSFLASACMLGQDALPYMIMNGHPGMPVALNTIGLHRHGFAPSVVTVLKKAYCLIRRRDLKLNDIVGQLQRLAEQTEEVRPIVDMFHSENKRGVARYSRRNTVVE